MPRFDLSPREKKLATLQALDAGEQQQDNSMRDMVGMFTGLNQIAQMPQEMALRETQSRMAQQELDQRAAMQPAEIAYRQALADQARANVEGMPSERAMREAQTRQINAGTDREIFGLGQEKLTAPLKLQRFEKENVGLDLANEAGRQRNAFDKDSYPLQLALAKGQVAEQPVRTDLLREQVKEAGIRNEALPFGLEQENAYKWRQNAALDEARPYIGPAEKARVRSMNADAAYRERAGQPTVAELAALFDRQALTKEQLLMGANLPPELKSSIDASMRAQAAAKAQQLKLDRVQQGLDPATGAALPVEQQPQKDPFILSSLANFLGTSPDAAIRARNVGADVYDWLAEGIGSKSRAERFDPRYFRNMYRNMFGATPYTEQ